MSNRLTLIRIVKDSTIEEGMAFNKCQKDIEKLRVQVEISIYKEESKS